MIVFMVDAATGPTPGRPATPPSSSAARRSPCSSPRTRPTTSSASWTPPSSTRSAGRRRSRSRPTTGAASPTCSTPSCGPCRPRATRRSPARPARTRPTPGRRRCAAGPARAVRRGRGRRADGRRRRRRRGRRRRRRRDAPRPTRSRPAGTPRWPPRTTSRRRSRSSAGRTSASRRCSTRSWARSGPIVSDTPGTTRDAIDTTIEWGRSEVVLIDTAGIRRRGKVASGPAAEKYSTMRALKAISRADVAVLVLDAHDGLTAQDAHVAGYVIEEGKGLVIAVNKWDIVEDKTHKSFDDLVIDAAARARVHRLRARSCRSAPRPASASRRCWSWRSTCGASDAGGSRPASSTGSSRRRWSGRRPRSSTGKRPKIRYVTQAAVAPPTFVFFTHRPRVAPLLVPALPREPAARRLRVQRDADPARVPGAGPREAAEGSRRQAARLRAGADVATRPFTSRGATEVDSSASGRGAAW